MYDTSLTDYPRLNQEESDSPRIQRAIDATENGILYIPKGDYDIKEPLRISNRCSLKMHPAARLLAGNKMDFVLCYENSANYQCLSLFNDDGSIYDNLGLFIEGGDIDGNGLASCLRITDAHHFTINNTAFHNGIKYGLCIGGDGEKIGHLYELICNNIYCKCTMKGLSGNIGIYSTLSDCHFNDCIVVDYTIGMRMVGSANRLSRCHIWGGTVAPVNMDMKTWSDIYAKRKEALRAGVYDADYANTEYQNDVPEMLIGSVAFDMQGVCNVLDGCYADTAEVGYQVKGDTRLIACDFFNNKLMGLKKTTAIRHLGGDMVVIGGHFRAPAGIEVLYEGIGEGVEWIGTKVADSMQFPDISKKEVD